MFSTLELGKYTKALILSGLALSVLGISYSAFSSESPELAAETQQEVYSHSVTYKNLGEGRGSVVYLDGKQVVWFISDFNGYKPEKRAEVVAQKLDNLVKQGLDPNTVLPVRSKNYTEVKAGNEYLFLADKENAEKFGVSSFELGCEWANKIREALGGKTLLKDYSVALIQDPAKPVQKPAKVAFRQNGYASWYGGRFHGRRSSDGSRYNMYEFTAAHKSLPFGSIVKVTNLRNKKVCTVKITDRGPYVNGRIIDVSKAAAGQLGMISSGVSPVKIEMVGKFK